MEVAGVVLGSVPLILYALDKYKRVWEGVKDTRNAKNTITTIRNTIFLQQKMLITTLQTLNPRFTKDTTMAEIEAALKRYHPNESDQFMSTISEMNLMMSDIARDLCPDAQDPLNWSEAQFEGRIWDWSNVKRGFGKTRRNEISNKLTMWNLTLANCGLEKREFSPDNEAIKVNEVQRRYDEKGTTKIRENVCALHNVISSALECDCPKAHRGNIQLNWHETKQLIPGRFTFAISSESKVLGLNADTQLSWKNMLASIEDMRSHPGQATANLASSIDAPPSIKSHPNSSSTSPGEQQQQAKPKKKVVKFLGYEIKRSESKKTKPKSSSYPSQPAGINEQMPFRPSNPAPTPAVKLCTVLQSSQEHQLLLKYIPILGSDFNKRISIISTDDSNVIPSTDMKRTVPLPMLLRKEVDRPTNRKLGLDWKQRFRFAAALVWAVFHLGDSPWLKECLNDELIHVFLDQNQGTSSPYLCAQPYLSYNFQRALSSPPPQPLASSSIAQFQSKQIQNIMLYTLAIRLIELGLNKPFTKLRQQYQKSIPPPTAPASSEPLNGQRPNSLPVEGTNATTVVDSNTPQTSSSSVNAPTACDDYQVAEQQIDKLRLDIGSFYAGAVECCLRFGSLERVSMNSFENTSFLKSFFDDIVAPIQATLELRLNL